jgi:hypothetical protein
MRRKVPPKEELVEAESKVRQDQDAQHKPRFRGQLSQDKTTSAFKSNICSLQAATGEPRKD